MLRQGSYALGDGVYAPEIVQEPSVKVSILQKCLNLF